MNYKKLILLFISLLMSCHADAVNANDYESYCTNSGGVVEDMPAEYSTHVGLVRGNSKSFCNFYLKDAFLAIGLETFASDKPTIAATYIKKLSEIDHDSPLWIGAFSNPAQNVCKNLGGAELGFVTNGGFANAKGQAGVCVFGDASMIASWTLVYMANHREGYDEIKNLVRAQPLNMHMPGRI